MNTLNKLLLSVAAVTAAGFVAFYAVPLSNYTLLYYYGLFFVLAVYFAIIVGGRWRSGLVVTAALIFGLGVVEAFSLRNDDRAINQREPGSFVLEPTLGWGHAHAGVFHHKKIESGAGRAIFDVTYTIDERLNRKVDSAEDGPLVAFFGDSMTFGEGLADNETLPQAFADAAERKLRVLNLAVSGFGPQQFLRALETDKHRSLLLGPDPKLFVLLTAPWHAERVACRAHAIFGPAYELENGKPVFRGPCYRDGAKMLGTIQNAIASTATYRVFFQNALLNHFHRKDMELYLQIMIRAARLAKEKYGAETLILYYNEWSDRPVGMNDAQIMRRLRNSGLHVIDASIDQTAYPDQPLRIPGDGHPTGLANSIRARMALQAYEQIMRERAAAPAAAQGAEPEPRAQPGPRPEKTAVWRLFDGYSHLYTTDCAEANEAQRNYNFALEGAMFFIETTNGPGRAEFHRFYNGNDYFYTTSAAAEGYEPQGVLGYVHAEPGAGRAPLYRSFNPFTGAHFYTTSKAEYDHAITQASHQTDAGIVGYVAADGATPCRPAIVQPAAAPPR